MTTPAFRKPLLLWLLLFLCNHSFAQPAGYGFGKQVLVNASQVSGTADLSNFVMLVSLTDTDLRTTANGGNVENGNGFDIIFTLGDCNTILDHQIEEYNAATGNYIAWVKVPTLFASSNTNIHMYYGNSAVSVDPSTTAVWGAEYAAVWHMNQDPTGSSPQLTDYTANTNDGIANGTMTSADLVTGQIGNAIDFDGSNDFFDCGADASTTINNDITVSAWMNSTAVSGHIINRGGGWDDPGYSLFLLSNAIRIELQRAGEKDIVDNGIGINAWRYVALTYNQTTGTIRCYIDGVQQGNTGTHTGPMGNPVENLNIGRKEQNGFYFDGIIDEGRVISAERTADWIATEYNNQNTPASFYAVSAEFTASNLCITLPVELLNFSVKPINQMDGLIEWATASETNNDYFLLEKSTTASEWIEIAKIDGAGNSFEKTNYKYTDKNVRTALVYYRLTQVDFDGTKEIFDIVSLQTNQLGLSPLFFPNPTKQQITLKSGVEQDIQIYDLTGKLLIEVFAPENQVIEVDLSVLKAGSYFIKSQSGTERLIKL